jgi:hypothetical protein
VTFEVPQGVIPSQIVSGGQTGVDRAALDAALSLDWPCGGWCPKGRRAEDGRISADYPVQETESKNYAHRTRWNVRDSDGTLILCSGPLSSGTSLTRKFAVELEKPFLIVDLAEKPTAATVAEWIESNRIQVLNVAGPRESSVPGIHALATVFLRTVLLRCSG